MVESIALIAEEEICLGFMLAGTVSKNNMLPVGQHTKSEKIEEFFNKIITDSDAVILVLSQKAMEILDCQLQNFNQQTPIIIPLVSGSPSNPNQSDPFLYEINSFLNCEDLR